MMPARLQVVSHINPLTYEVDALRTFMLARGASTFGLTLDLSFLLLSTMIAVIIGVKVYPRVVM
jgi:ABC-2 type transport system permease protein